MKVGRTVYFGVNTTSFCVSIILFKCCILRRILNKKRVYENRIMSNRRPNVMILESQAHTQSESPVPEDCHQGESQIEYNDYSQQWDFPTQLESQQHNDRQETIMLDNNTITAKDISTQTDQGNNNIARPNLSSNEACTQTLLTEENSENLKVANEYFGMFVARELSNVPQIKRRQIMFEIVRLLELRSF